MREFKAFMSLEEEREYRTQELIEDTKILAQLKAAGADDEAIRTMNEIITGDKARLRNLERPEKEELREQINKARTALDDNWGTWTDAEMTKKLTEYERLIDQYREKYDSGFMDIEKAQLEPLHNGIMPPPLTPLRQKGINF